MFPLVVIFLGFYSAVVSFCLALNQAFREPVSLPSFVVAQVVLVGITIICLVIGIVMQRKERKAEQEQEVVEFRECVASVNDDEYFAEIFKSNIYGMCVRVIRLKDGQEIFRSLLVDETYTESDVRQYLKLAKYLSRGGAPISYNKPQNRRKQKPIGDKQ